MNANDMQIGGSHYRSTGSAQHWDFVTANLGPTYLIGNATKYITRWRKKNGIEDLRKAIHYTAKLEELALDGKIQPVAFPDRLPRAKFYLENEVAEQEQRVINLLLDWRSPDDLRLAGELLSSMITLELQRVE